MKQTIECTSRQARQIQSRLVKLDTAGMFGIKKGTASGFGFNSIYHNEQGEVEINISENNTGLYFKLVEELEKIKLQYC